MLKLPRIASVCILVEAPNRIDGLSHVLSQKAHSERYSIVVGHILRVPDRQHMVLANIVIDIHNARFVDALAYALIPPEDRHAARLRSEHHIVRDPAFELHVLERDDKPVLSIQFQAGFIACRLLCDGTGGEHAAARARARARACSENRSLSGQDGRVFGTPRRGEANEELQAPRGRKQSKGLAQRCDDAGRMAGEEKGAGRSRKGALLSRRERPGKSQVQTL
mmetsp:Transcript_19388/g.34617  ORF Transcript_19388/g.34617 Transcript_19388/m.34617 type:complete len:223 (-) Transcript_19388:360-1028(-)